VKREGKKTNNGRTAVITLNKKKWRKKK